MSSQQLINFFNDYKIKSKIGFLLKYTVSLKYNYKMIFKKLLLYA